LDSIPELASETAMEGTQNSEPRYPKRASSSRGMCSSVTLNFTKNEILIPGQKHNQATQFPSSLMEGASQGTRLVS